MAKAKIFKIQGGGKTYFIPANSVKTVAEAAMSVGLSAGGYFGLTVYSKEGETAEEFVTRKGGTITEATMDIDYSRASIAEELPPATGGERYGAYEAPPDTPPDDAWTNEFNDYLKLIDSGLYPNLPQVSNLQEYKGIANQLDAYEEYYFSGVSASLDQWREWRRYPEFGSRYGDLDDYYPTNFTDFILNYDKAIQQLNTWITEAGSEATGFTDEQVREWQDYIWHSRFRETGDSFFADVGDFFNNYDEAVDQLGIWKKRAGEAEAERLKGEEYTKWSREQTKYAAQERYGETPMYSENFTAWLNQQGQFSGALEKYVESQYPSLRSQFEAQAGRLTGFPTREEARAEASRREAGFQSWLGGEVPGLKQEYLAQHPAERGERLYMQSPNVRGINW